MYRIRLILPKRQSAYYKNSDILHDALINAWEQAGCKAEQVMGINAGIWNFGALGWHDNAENRVHTLVVSSPDPGLSQYLKNFRPSDVCYARTSTEEAVDFSKAEICEDQDPIVTGQKAIGAVMLSPLAISRKDKKNGQRWHNNLNDLNLSSAINNRLTRMAGRKVQLNVQPDHLYIRSNPKYSTLVQIKETSKKDRIFVIGMRIPLVLQGNDEDLRLAWYAGIGEKTRNGFGCIGLAEKGVGR